MQTKNRPTYEQNAFVFKCENGHKTYEHIHSWNKREVPYSQWKVCECNKRAKPTTEKEVLDIPFNDTMWLNQLLKEMPLDFHTWVAENYSDEYATEEGLMNLYEDEDILEAYKEYLYEQFN